MEMLKPVAEDARTSENFAALCNNVWQGRVATALDQHGRICRLNCWGDQLVEVCQWLSRDLDFAFATLIVEELPDNGWSLLYIFYKGPNSPWVYVEPKLDALTTAVPSISGLVHGPSADWREREAEDLFGLKFEGHPRLGEFILHEDWPEGANPMRHDFDAHERFEHREADPKWEPPMIVVAPGAFAMPVGPVFSDFAESAHFLLETVGEDVIHTITRFFYKYRGVEKIAEGQNVGRVLLLAERFSGTAAFAHALAFCQAIEAICGTKVPARARALRTVLAELERLRHHAAVITGICNSTALAVATSQAALIEEDLLRLSCKVAEHRYLFGALKPGGLALDIPDETCSDLSTTVGALVGRLHELHEMLRYSSGFLDRLEEIGGVSNEQALSYGLVGPVARASGIARDLRKLFPYAAYDAVGFTVPVEQEGDGYSRLRVFFQEAEQAAMIIHQVLQILPDGPACADPVDWYAGAALGAVEAPAGAAFHWVRLNGDGTVARYSVTPPSFVNCHGFHLAAENFAFQDFPIILASFGLSIAECDR